MISKIDAEKQQTLNLGNITLQINGTVYERTQQDIFLRNHNFTPLTKSAVSFGEYTGTVLFEVDSSDANENQSSWIVDIDGIRTTVGIIDNAIVPQVENLVKQHQQIEEDLVQAYNVQGKADLSNPYLVKDPYGTAPLAAVALFETNEEMEISVIVKGKQSETDISYTIAGYNVQHVIQIFGLYADYLNTVELIGKTRDGNEVKQEIQIQTEAVPNYINSQFSVTQEKEHVDLMPGLTATCTNYRTVIDSNAEIRWYSTIPSIATALNEFPQDGTLWFSSNGDDKSSIIYHMNFLGKILGVYHYGDFEAHHDGTILPNGNLVYFTGRTTLHQINPETGDISLFLDLNDVLENIGSLDLRGYGEKTDWLHMNTIDYFIDDVGKPSLLLSIRNQSMIIKFNYPDLSVDWVLSPTVDHAALIQTSLEGKYIKRDLTDNNEFEWFYVQHEPVCLPNIDNNPNTTDLLVFDNGGKRGVVIGEGTDEKYSRVVHYRIDNESKTVKQITEFGKEKGENYYCDINGGAQYLENGNLLGCFNTLAQGTGNWAKIVEANPSGEIIKVIEANEITYRAYRFSVNSFIVPTNMIFEKCGTYYMEHNYNWVDTEDNYNAADKVENVTVKRLQSVDGKLEAVFLAPDITKAKLIAYNEQHVYELPLNCQASIASALGANMNLEDGVYSLCLVFDKNGETKRFDIDQKLLQGETSDVITKDNLTLQNEFDSNLLATIQSSNWSLHNPNITVDPYNVAPLSAIAAFVTSQPATITVKVESKNGAAPIVNEFKTMSTEHAIPIYGLYSGEATNVTLTATYADGTTDEKTVSLTGGALPPDFQAVGVVAEDTDTTQMANGWTFLMAGSLQGYVYAIDEAGAVRWMLSEKGMGAASVFLPLENGNYLIGGDKSFGQYYKYSLFELNLTGQIVHEYMVDGYHHDAVELPSGNLLVLANNVNGEVMEDTIYELDRNTGEILRTWDFNGYFNVGNYNEAGQHVSDINYGASSTDWMHINGIDYNEQTDSLLISSRHQDAVISFKLSTGEIEWILSNPDDQWPEYLADKLLTPVGDNFEWQYGQHNAIWLPNGDVMLFDNGDYRSKTADGVLDPATEAYSRAVIYHVDAQAKTVSQIWEFGKDKGPDYFAVNVSSVQYLGENHYLIDFGGIVKNSAGEATYSIMDGITGSSRSEVYEIKDGNVIFHANVERPGLHGNTFRAVRLQPYASNEELDLTTAGTRLGSLYSRGLAQTIDFDSGIAISGGPDVSITDNGAQLVVSATLANSASNAAIIFASAQQNYRVALSGGSSIAYTLNKSEIPAGTYRLYLELDGTYYNLAQSWTNTTIARAYPTGYDIKVTTSSEGKGTVYGSGIYYANTPFTVSVKPSENAQFTGWYCNGALLSTNTTFSLTATEDMTLIAAFDGDDIGNQPGGGGAGGGGAVGGEIAGKPSASVNGAGGKVDVADDGTVTITPDAGYQIAKITVNNEEVDIPADGKLTGLNENDKVVVTFEKAAADMLFVDVANNAWYADAVKYVYENGMMNGVSATEFAPNSTTTRGMIVTMLYRLEGEPNADASTFADVSADKWYADAVGWAAANGVVNGISTTTFAPDSPITREQMATILHRYAAWKNYDVSASQDLSAYSDASQISAYAQTAMQWSNAEGLITGNTATTLNPQGEATRAEVATILMRFCESIASDMAA